MNATSYEYIINYFKYKFNAKITFKYYIATS